MTSITGMVNAVLERIEFGPELAHLESLEANPVTELRFMRRGSDGVFDAIQRSDATLPV